MISLSEPYQRMKADYTRHLLMWSFLREYADHLKYRIEDVQQELNRDVDKKKNKQIKANS